MVELIWDGKYDANRKRVSPLRVELPFQTVETVNESAQQRQKSLFAMGSSEIEWRNRLIWGDKKYVLPSLLPEFAGKVDLIYIDPPFKSDSDFSFNTQVGTESFTKEPSIIEQKAYRDTWGKGLDSYLQWLYETLVILHELLSETGSLYVHVDWHAGHYAKVLLDDVFGQDGFRNQIIWWYYDKFPTGGNVLDRQHDFIFQYVKSDRYVTNLVQELRVEPGRPTEVRKKVGGKITRIRDEETGKTTFVEGTTHKKISDVWRIPLINSMSAERLGYPTQKPEALLERIIAASSNEGDLVLDCFCGSGTTASTAERLNRRWITCDLGRFAIHTARKRLLTIPDVKPFVVQNLGKYERQIWQEAEFGENSTQIMRQYHSFILDLYKAEPIDGYIWLHGIKDGRMVHVGSVDSPVAVGDVRQIAIEAQKARIKHIDILGWDFALDMNETMGQISNDAGIKVRFVRIPREILEKKAIDQDDIRFYELAALSADHSVKGHDVTVALTDFMVAAFDIPEDVVSAVKSWSEWIDYWAIDFNFHDDTFHNEWQSYRTRKDRKLELSHTHTYKEAGRYTVLVKVIDILGNDTTKAIEVEVK